MPVTTGGKSGSRWLMTGAIEHAEDAGGDDGAEDAEQADVRDRCAMASIGPTAAKVTPIITGSWMPNHWPDAERLDQR